MEEDPVTLLASSALAIAAAGTATSILTRPKTPKFPQAAPPPQNVPPALPPPPLPTDTEAGEGVADEKKRLRRRRGVQSTILTTPLGTTGASNTAAGRQGGTLLGQ